MAIIPRRALNMLLTGSHILYGNENVPFNKEVYSWSNMGDDHLITYDANSRIFTIPFASLNDYYITYEISIKTCSIPDTPIVGLEFMYNNLYKRIDYLAVPLKTLQITHNSIYHVSEPASPDILTIAVKVVGQDSHEYSLTSFSTCDITGNIIIMGL